MRVKIDDVFRFSDIHWLDASSEDTIELGLMQMAQAKNAPQQMRHSPGLILQWLSQSSKWLIIYDNADNHYAVVEKFIPPGNEGNILITSRNGELRRLALDSENVANMAEDEAVSMILKSAMLDCTSEDIRNVAKKIVSELGGIPLALDQAGAYIQKCGCGIDGYLDLYRKKKDKLMSRKEFKGASDYGRSTYGTWDISLQKIGAMAMKENDEEAEAAQSAIRLLKIFAFLNHENIPEEIFQNAAENYMDSSISEGDSDFPMTLLDHQSLFLAEDGEWDRMQFLDGMKVLLSLSLVSIVNHLYSMHLLVKAWSRSCIPEREISDHYHRARALLCCAVVPDWHFDNYAFCKLLAPHIRSNILHGQELGLKKKYYDHEYGRFAIVFDRIGSLDEKEKIWGTAVTERKANLGSDHPSTLIAMSSLALNYQCQGRWDEAEKLQVEVMNTSKVKLGSDHPSTLATMHNLALTYKDQGRWDEAEKLQVDVMNTRKVKFGSDHPDTLITMNQLASTYQNQGRWSEAEKLQVDVMNTRKVKLGSDHPSTLITMHNLASTYQNQGRWDEAEKLQVEVMNVKKVKLGSDHPSTLVTMNQLASTYQNQGRWDEAEKLQVEVMNTRKVKLGSDHPDTLITMASLASTYKSKKRLDEAMSLLAHAVQHMQQAMGHHHPTTLHHRYHLDSILDAGQAYQQQVSETDKPAQAPAQESIRQVISRLF